MIYLDNAATSYPKPRQVSDEVRRCLTQYGGNPGRGAHYLSLAAAEKVYECRSLAASMFEAPSPDRVVFTLNTTHALNTIIKGLLRRGDHVLISDLEHNAVYRPIWRLANDGIITYDVFPSMVGEENRSAARICAAIARRLRPETRMVVCTHASNLCSATMPIAEIGRFCHRHGLLFVVDGAQSAGHLPLSLREDSIDALCLPGHKGLLGPQGCGMAILGEGILPESLIEGGNGVDSLEGGMPDYPPERYESGTLPTPAIAGLCEGMRIVSERGIPAISEYERSVFRRARELLGNMPGVTLYVPEYEGSVLLFNLDGVDSEHTAGALNRLGICVRGGYHCAALAHKTLKTPAGGAVRASFGIYNHPSHAEALATALRRIRTEILH